MWVPRFTVLAVALLVPCRVRAQEVEGWLELRTHLYSGVEGERLQVVELVRPEFSAPLSQRLWAVATVEMAFSQGRDMQVELQRTLQGSDMGPLLDLMDCTWPEESNTFLDVSEVQDYLNVERLYLDAYLPAADLRVGRQAIQWGSGFMVSPTDPFPQVLLMEPWSSRAGVNAVRATFPIDRHQIQLVGGTDDAFQHARLALRGTANVLQTDISLLGVYREEASDGLLGLDLRGTLGAGFWFEGAWHVREGADDYAAFVVGLDYSFPLLDSLVLTGQYYRNGSGSAQVDFSQMAGGLSSGLEPPQCDGTQELFATDDDATDDDATSDAFAPTFYGRDYAMLSALLMINPEVSLNALWIQNLGDGSAMAVPVLMGYPTGFMELAVAAQIPLSLWGDGGELHPSHDDLQISYDTGAVPLTLDFSGLLPAATFIFWTRFNF